MILIKYFMKKWNIDFILGDVLKIIDKMIIGVCIGIDKF